MELSSFANMFKENEISIKIIKRILNICLIGFLVDYLISNLTYTKTWGILQDCLEVEEGCLTCEELVGEFNHTTESVTELFSFIDFEWIIL